ncbi:MAG TPA: hypothetical protein DCZ95_06050 [Verrucomicrobia bacterium]|nr:MAG: hypothetical protein A2X46_03850 [Lentisphaerae bacterium GWF2_57_35]HBA83640.1 hypothetical protein [Verrucomicrobiota bacterium]
MWTGVLAAASAFGQTGEFDRGFAMLRELGLPDVAEAEYVNLTLHGPYSDNSYFFRQMKLTGNAWKLPAATNAAPSTFIVEQSRQLEVYKPAELEKLRQQEAQTQKGPKKKKASGVYFGYGADDRMSGQWRTADLARDLQKIAEYLEKEDSRNFEWQFSSGAAGQIFLFAAQANRKGYGQEASRLVKIVFEKAGDRKRVIAQGINHLADGQYADAYAAFRRTRDWQAYHDALRTLGAKFPIGWQKRGAVQRLIGLLETHLQAGPAPKAAGEGLTDEDQSLAAELASKPKERQPYYTASSPLWILPIKPAPNLPTPPTPSTLERIKARGPSSLPLLMALLDDSYLTEWSIQDAQGLSHSFSFSSVDSMSEEMTDQLFRNMERPATRGDIARILLSPLLLMGSDEARRLDGMNDDEFRAEARSWYDANRTNTVNEWAKKYMEEGQSEQKTAALQYLIEHSKPEELPLLERHIVDDERPERSMSAVMEYAAARGKEAEAFVQGYVEKYWQAKESEMAEYDSLDADARARMQQSSSNEVRQLLAAVTGRSTDEMLMAVAEGREDLEANTLLISQRLKKMDAPAALTAILGAVVKAQEPAIRRQLLYLPLHVPALNRKIMARMTGETPEAAPDMGLHAESWTILANDQRALPETPFEAQPVTVADIAAWTIEKVYGPVQSREEAKALQLLGRRATALTQERARLRVAGKTEAELPPYPSADKVSKEQRESLMERLEQAKTEDVQQAVSAISLDEWLALDNELEKNEALNRKLQPLSLQIVQVETPAHSSAADRFTALKGRPLDRKVVEDLLEYSKQEVGAGQGVLVQILHPSCLDGIRIQIGPPPDAKALYPYGIRLNEEERSVVGWCQVSSLANAKAVWMLPAPSVESPTGKTAEKSLEDELLATALNEAAQELRQGEDRQQIDFWSQIHALVEGQAKATRMASIRFVGVPAADRLSPAKESKNDDQ